MERVSTVWLRDFLRRALEEDFGPYGDLTSQLLFPPERMGAGRFEAREEGVLAGAALAPEVAALVDPGLEVEVLVEEGATVTPYQPLVRVKGALASMLAAERLTLNLMARLSGIATKTRSFVEAASGRIDILDTRKTTPLHRPLEKYAVRVGGGRNHRYALFDAAMLKDTHRRAAGEELAEAVRRLKLRLGYTQHLVVEVESLEAARVAADAGADSLLLDNMEPPQLAEVVAELGDRVRLEASGGVTLERLPAIAASGVHAASSGALTHSARWLDLSFELEG